MLEELRNWIWPIEPSRAGQVPDVGSAAIPLAPRLASGTRPLPAPRPGLLQPTGFVVDDDEGVNRFLVRVLESIGLEVRAFRNAQTAVAALDQRLPDIIFLDVALENSDAIEVIRGLKERGYSGVVQVISGSNISLLEDVKRVGDRHGLAMRPPLAKPFRADAVRTIVRDAGLGGQVAERIKPNETAPMIQVALSDALRAGWLEVWYQPKIDLQAKTFAGAEALTRCRHPQHGILPPASFLPGADDAAMADLTRFVLRTVLHDWTDFANVGVALRAAMNAPMSSLASVPIADLVREHRPRDQRWPGLIIEVSESEVIRDLALAHEIVTQLRIYDVSFAIDDFGEGYSSFARLRELPFSEIKLDRSCVTGCSEDVKNAGICRAIIELAHHFGCLAVAEGVETGADLQALYKMGCDLGQGFFFGRPMPKAQLIGSLGQRNLAPKAAVG